MLTKSLQINIPDNHDTTKGLDDLEKVYIEHIFKYHKYNQSAAAKSLGLSRGCLRQKLAKYFGDQYV